MPSVYQPHLMALSCRCFYIHGIYASWGRRLFWGHSLQVICPIHYQMCALRSFSGLRTCTSFQVVRFVRG